MLFAKLEVVLLTHWGETAADGAHDIAHIRRVWINAQAIVAGEGRPVDMEILCAATVFHDLVNLPKDAADRHLASRKSAEAASHILRAQGFPVSKLGAVEHAISAHSFSAGIAPESTEAQILQDADRLDALGAVGIARTFYVAGALGKALYDPDDAWAERRSNDDIRYALDHFAAKLLRLAATMRTAKGRELAATRTQVMIRFLETFGLEARIEPRPK